MKFLLIIITLALLVNILIRPILKNNKPRKKPKDESIEEMQECAYCGVYTSANEAFLSQGKYYCSKECMQKDTQ